jgi:putative DNA primase/helicase
VCCQNRKRTQQTKLDSRNIEMSTTNCIDAERSILGAILLNDEIYEQAAELPIDDFSIDSHRLIFLRMRDLATTGRPIDSITLTEELEQHKELEKVGDAAYIGHLLDGLPDRPSIGHYVKMVRSSADRRRAVKLAERAQLMVNDPGIPTTALAEIGNCFSEIVCHGESQPPQFSEEALALRFSRKYEDVLRYVDRLRRWLRWDGTRWVEDDTMKVFDLARGICRDASAECSNTEKATAMRLASKATSAAVERLAEADRRHAATVPQFDANPWILNTPTGTVDLRTGEIREHRPADYITKITLAGPGGDCPLWHQFLDRITNGDVDMKSFLQRMVGYALTGSIREHALFFLYGTGANGKSVFLSVISDLLGNYAKTAPVSSFTASTNEQHPTDIAGLRGARFVTANETEEGARWAESKIKSLTGGDKISARFMRRDFFEFTPEFKLVITGNHQPSLRSVDEAIRRRLHLVPFTVTIPEDERDATLKEKLREEFEGILAWAIQGCLDWQHQGLDPPSAVREATADYMAAEDAIGRWTEDRCVIEKQFWTSAGALFEDYQKWCEKTGELGGSQKRFTQKLEARGFRRQRTNRAKGFAGIGLREDVVPDVPDDPLLPVSRARTPHIEESGTSGTKEEWPQ